MTVAILAGCSGSNSQLGAAGSMPQTSAIASAHALAHRTLPASSVKVLHSFDGDPDGERPEAGLDNLESSQYGTLYGTTFYGGTYRVGTVYSVDTADGAEKVLHSFGSGSDGLYPYAGLIHVGEALYGTTRDGGTSDKGTVYSISTDGKEKVLHSFGGGSDGARPIAGLTNEFGTLYGTTRDGGTSDKGTVYSIGTDGTEEVLYSFGGGSDGAHPGADVIDAYGTLYGTTDEGGTSDKGTVYSVDTFDNTEKVLHSFSGGSDGDGPFAGLIDVNGTLYGTTFLGGSDRCFRFGCGTVYSIKMDGTEKVLYSFGGLDGTKPEARLLEDNNVLYGTTSEGGTYGRGTVYALTL